MNEIKKMIFPCGKYHSQYGRYIGWSFISNVIISVENVLSTHSILSAVSIDNTELVRTANYVGKDVIGQIGGLWYMSKIGEKADKDPKKFLLYSNIIQQSTYIANCITPIFPNHFLYIAGVANAAANISFTGFGAINTKCIKELAIDNNIGEIYSKITVVNTIGSSLGMVFGLYLTSLFPEHESRLCLIPILGIIRVYTYRKAIKNII